MWWSFTTHLQHSPLDDHHIKRICLIKTLLVENLWEKPSKGKKVQYSYNSLRCSWYVRIASLKTLPVKLSGIKPGRREKKVQYTNILLQAYSLLNVEVDNNFMNKSTRLSLERIY